MQLISFLQLTNDLNQNYSVFYRPNKKERLYPLSKLTITSEGAALLTGSLPKTLLSINQMIAPLHHKNLPLFIKHQNKIIKVYGIQIDIDQQKIYLF